MIHALQITIDRHGNIEIATGPYLGHHAGTLKTRVTDAGDQVWVVNGRDSVTLTAAMHRATAAAYDYVAQQEDEHAYESAARAA